jgi:polyisoprenoid-binding protein YceI
VRAIAAVLALAAVALPAAAAPETYAIDPAHTYPSLEFPHMGISVWRGKFTRTRGTVVLDRAARTGEVDITVEADSIDFGQRTMNQVALGSEWLNVELHPTLRYGGPIRFEGDVPAAVQGRLTLLGVTKPVELRIQSFKCIPHPVFRREVCGADASGSLDRSEFGLTQSVGAGGEKITLRIQVEALKQ